MEYQLKNPYAKLDCGEIVNINTATKDTNYFCIGCGEPLVLKDGDVITKHFAHKASSDCSGGLETTIHKKAKEAFLKCGTANFSKVGHESESLTILKAEDEVAYTAGGKKIVVDVVIETKELGAVFVEIWHTHKTDKEKIKVIKALGFPCVEVDVSHINGVINYESYDGKQKTSYLDSKGFHSLITKPRNNAKWLTLLEEHPATQDLRAKITGSLESKYRQEIDRLQREIRLKDEEIDDLNEINEGLGRNVDKKEYLISALTSKVLLYEEPKEGDIICGKHEVAGYAYDHDKVLYVYLEKDIANRIQVNVDKKGKVVIPISIRKTKGYYVVLSNAKARSYQGHY